MGSYLAAMACNAHCSAFLAPVAPIASEAPTWLLWRATPLAPLFWPLWLLWLLWLLPGCYGVQRPLLRFSGPCGSYGFCGSYLAAMACNAPCSAFLAPVAPNLAAMACNTPCSAFLAPVAPMASVAP